MRTEDWKKECQDVNTFGDELLEEANSPLSPELELNQLILAVGFLLHPFDSDYISF